MREICKESSCVRVNLRFLSLCIFSSCLQVISSPRGNPPQTSCDNLIFVYPNVKTPFTILNWGIAFRQNFLSMVELFSLFVRDCIGHDFVRRLCLWDLAIWNYLLSKTRYYFFVPNEQNLQLVSSRYCLVGEIICILHFKLNYFEKCLGMIYNRSRRN